MSKAITDVFSNRVQNRPAINIIPTGAMHYQRNHRRIYG